MRKKILVLLLAMATAGVAFGSGSYKGRGKMPPKRLEAEYYSLGKQIFTHKAELADTVSDRMEAQARDLEALSSQLPDDARERANLRSLAGRLSEEEFDALLYYVSVRYKVEVGS